MPRPTASVLIITCAQLLACGSETADGPTAPAAPLENASKSSQPRRAADARYAIQSRKGKLRAVNPLQRLAAEFGEHGPTLQGLSATGEPWTATVTAEEFGCEGSVERLPRALPHVITGSANRLEQAHGPVRAWYVNDATGIEQGFDIAERPACLDVDPTLRVSLLVDGLRLRTRDDHIELFDENDDVVLFYKKLLVIDANDDVLDASMRADGDQIHIDVHAAHAKFPIRIDPLWTFQQEIYALGPTEGFAYEIDIDDSTIVVSSCCDDQPFPDVGSAFVYAKSGGLWSLQQKLTAPDAGPYDFFGNSVAIAGDTIVVGAQGHSSFGDPGAAYVFVRNGTSWSLQQKLGASDPSPNAQFGWSVDIWDDTIVVGAPRKNDDNGALYFFDRTGTEWTEVAIMPGWFDSKLGGQVAMVGDVAVAGAPEVYNDGITLRYERDATGWKAFGAYSLFFAGATGYTAELNSDYVVFGAHDLSKGCAFIKSAHDRDQMGDVYISENIVPEGIEISHPWTAISENLVALGSHDSTLVYRYHDGEWLYEDIIPEGSWAVAVGTDIVARRSLPHAVKIYELSQVAVGESCIIDAHCPNGFCRDRVCCSSHCGGDVDSDCQACVNALTGLPDGTCGTILGAANYACRPGSGDMCDPAEQCDGSSSACPVDVLEPATTLCRPGSGDVCDPDELCTGLPDDACPEDVVAPATFVCNPGSGDGCVADARCAGAALTTCPPNATEADGTSCQTTGQCSAGTCVGGTPGGAGGAGRGGAGGTSSGGNGAEGATNAGGAGSGGESAGGAGRGGAGQGGVGQGGAGQGATDPGGAAGSEPGGATDSQGAGASGSGGAATGGLDSDGGTRPSGDANACAISRPAGAPSSDWRWLALAACTALAFRRRWRAGALEDDAFRQDRA